MTRREALSHPLAIAGVVITTVAAVLFISLVLAALAGMLTNPYAGLVVFVALPALFVMGLILIPIGVRKQRQARLRDPNAVVDWPVVDLRVARVRQTTLLVIALTAVNLVIVLLAGYGGTGWSPASAGGPAIRRCSRSSRRGAPSARGASTATSASARVHHPDGWCPPTRRLATNSIEADSAGRRDAWVRRRRPAARATSPDARSAIACVSSANTPTTRRTRRP
jgi:hypothetical protein